MKKNVTIRIDENLVKKAKDLGLNISKVSENALKEMIARIERPVSPKEREDCPDACSHGELGAAAGIRTRVVSVAG